MLKSICIFLVVCLFGFGVFYIVCKVVEVLIIDLEYNIWFIYIWLLNIVGIIFINFIDFFFFRLYIDIIILILWNFFLFECLFISWVVIFRNCLVIIKLSIWGGYGIMILFILRSVCRLFILRFGGVFKKMKL